MADASLGGASPVVAVEQLLADAGLGPSAGADERAAANLKAPAGGPPADPPAGDPPAGDPPAGDPPAGDPPVDVDDLNLGVEPPKPDPDAPPSTITELAERAGMKVEDLYKLNVPMPDGADAVSLGTLKDLSISSGSLEARELEIGERRETFENDMIRARQELSEIVGLLPKVPDALIARARAAQAEHLDRERIALLEIKPEWKDDTVYAQAQDDILEAVADYGFTRSDLDLIVDHRLTKLLHDFSRLKVRIAAANAKGKQVRQQESRQGRQVSERQRAQQGRKAARSKVRPGSAEAQTSAVADVLRNA